MAKMIRTAIIVVMLIYKGLPSEDLWIRQRETDPLRGIPPNPQTEAGNRTSAWRISWSQTERFTCSSSKDESENDDDNVSDNNDNNNDINFFVSSYGLHQFFFLVRLYVVGASITHQLSLKH